MTLWVAIIGSGPAGYYTAEALTKDLGENVRIDIIDRLPTPYGLIRAGVAPDHQSIKNVTRRYEKTNLAENVRFVGNLEIGDAVSIKELLALYDAVVLATGAPHDRKMGVKGDDLPGVVGSARFVGWYNAHPDFRALDLDIDVEGVAVIGNGNVAVDAARVLAKTPDEMRDSDLARHAAEKIHRARIKNIYIIGRRGPLEAKFTPKELGELGELATCVTVVDPGQLPDPETPVEPSVRKNLSHLAAFARNERGGKPKTLEIMFYARPVEVLGEDRVTGLRLERTKVEDGRSVGTGHFFDLPCGLVIPCIGYRSIPIPHVPFDNDRGHFVHENGMIAPGLFCTGWARRGPTGTIGTNKPDAFEIAQHIIASIKPSGKPGRDGLDKLVRDRDLWIVRFVDWKKIEAAEEAAAAPGAPRAKIADKTRLIAAAKGEP